MHLRAYSLSFQRPTFRAKGPRFQGALMVRARKARSHRTVSNDKRAIEVGGRLRAYMFDPSLPVRAEIVVAQAVLLAIDYGFEASFQSGPLRWIDFDLED